ncbi:MAG: hypothetical protein ACI9ZF_000855 [Bradyrhizobium sp.]|jgi:hypothetical protein
MKNEIEKTGPNVNASDPVAPESAAMMSKRDCMGRIITTFFQID